MVRVMARINVEIIGISDLKWMEWGNLIEMTIISTTMGKNPLEEMGSPHSQPKNPNCSTWVQSQK